VGRDFLSFSPKPPISPIYSKDRTSNIGDGQISRAQKYRDTGTDDEISEEENSNDISVYSPQSNVSLSKSNPTREHLERGFSHSTSSPKTTLSTKQPTESRIIAPYVSKLTPNSVIEIRLQSMIECAAVLCSVDVLKMRSDFFQEILEEQDQSKLINTDNRSSDTGIIWRKPLIIPENSPFEAAAFLVRSEICLIQM
jgi:hypothetical protein